MKPLDLITLVYIISAISLLFAVLMFLFYKMTPTIKGPLLWSLASFSSVICSFLFAAFPLIYGYVAFVVSGSITILTIGLHWAGIRRFKGLPVDYRIVGGLVLLQFLLGSIFYSLIPMPNARMVIFSVITIFGSLMTISELLKPIEKPYRIGFLLCTTVFFIYTLTSVFRIVTIIYERPGSPYIATQANLTFYFFINLTQALLLFSFVFLIGIRISEGLKKKVEDQRKFYSIISHDLRGPVGMINVMLNMVNHDNALDLEEKNQMLLDAEKVSASTYHLLQNLLVWSKNQQENLQPKAQLFNLDKVMQENIAFMRPIAAPKSISIEYGQHPDLYCLADSMMIDTVVRNLLSNAVKFTNSGGYIRISAEKSGASVRFVVSDNGIGMNEDVLKNLFSARQRNSLDGTSGEKGSGLGLTICKEFVEANKGSLQIKSAKNQGTEIAVTLPTG